ncbi:MAG: SH3 domain-containing protein [Anaerolineaceae bacterium]|nr:SH3 domain-containing protein [Anaerolineaceae bacterium]
MRSKKILLLVIALCLLTMPTVAQEAEATAEISWPPPVYLLRGEVSLRGTVNLPGMTSYYIEYRALDDDLMAPDSRAFLPVTLPSGTPVVDDVLGAWDTSAVADGLYELRLNVVTPGGEMMRQVLGPLRVENERMSDEGMAIVVEEETPVPDESPSLTARVNANVRTGDNTSFPAIDALLTGESAPILGVSSRGSGWYQIALPNGRRGWISDVVVLVSGNIENLPRIVPPPLPPPPTLTPVPANADLIVEWINFEPEQPRCNEAVKITAQVANIGSGNSGASGVILVQDWHINTGTISATTSGGFPALEPGQRFTAVMNLTVTTFFNEGHRLVVTLDTSNAVAESNEGNNSASRDYTLAQAGC